MKRYIKANDYDVAFAYEEDQPEYGVMTQDNHSARYNLIIYKDRKTAERWRDKLIDDPSYKMFQRALRYAKYGWDDAISNNWVDDKYYTDASGYSDSYIIVVNKVPIIID